MDRIRDDPVLCTLDIPLPNINAKSITTFISKEEKKANFRATTIPKAPPQQRVLSDEPIPEAPALPATLPLPNRPQVQYTDIQHVSGQRPNAKRKIDLSIEHPEPITADDPQYRVPAPPTTSTLLQPPAQTFNNYIPAKAANAPILLVVPQQPLGHSVGFQQPHASQGFPLVYRVPPTPPPIKPSILNKSEKPCAACGIPNCGGKRKRYTPSKEKTAHSKQKIFTFCPTSRRSTTKGYEGTYDDYEHFKLVVDEELEKKRN